MILINHGIFSFGKTAKESYLRMINLVNIAEKRLKRKINLKFENEAIFDNPSNTILPYIRCLISKKSTKYCDKNKWVFEVRNNKSINEILNKKNLASLVKLGVATPDHVIRTKSNPLLLTPFSFDDKIQAKNMSKWVEQTEFLLDQYIYEYEKYFDRNSKLSPDRKEQLDPIPRLNLIPKLGLIGIGFDKKSAKVAADIGQAWIETVLSAISIGTFSPVGEKDTFDLEYWSLEQAKLGKKNGANLSGFIVAITGAGGVIGSQIAKKFKQAGAEIIALDLNKNAAEETANSLSGVNLAIGCDMTKSKEVEEAFKKIVMEFGGLDILISNAGAAWESSISKMKEDIFRKSLEINLFSHYYASQKAIEIFHAQDFAGKQKDQIMGGQILFNISKQALNPGPNFGSYGIAKAALLALMRQISLEEGINKIRSNGINADRIKSGLLNPEMIKKRAKSRGITEDAYIKGNLLKTEVLAEDVANAFLALAKLEKTTGALLTVDGGNIAAMVR